MVNAPIKLVFKRSTYVEPFADLGAYIYMKIGDKGKILWVFRQSDGLNEEDIRINKQSIND